MGALQLGLRVPGRLAVAINNQRRGQKIERTMTTDDTGSLEAAVVTSTDSKMTDAEHDGDEPLGMADALMSRGEQLRMLRLMAERDEVEREAESSVGDGVGSHHDVRVANGSRSERANAGSFVEDTDEYEILPTGCKMLNYDSYLRHQRYYDDLKHVDYQYIDYGKLHRGRLIIEQRKSLGKGGICWDAAFILAEYMIANEKEWNSIVGDDNEVLVPRLLELGAGTGLAGYLIAKGCERDAHVITTDLPELLPLMKNNFDLNFASIGCGCEDRRYLTEKFADDATNIARRGTAEAKVLRWGEQTDYDGAPYDIVFAADVVASLYDPVALAHTFYDLCGPNSKVFLSYKRRLDEPHKVFEDELKRLFQFVETIKPMSRNKNPDVNIIKAERRYNDALQC